MFEGASKVCQDLQTECPKLEVYASFSHRCDVPAGLYTSCGPGERRLVFIACSAAAVYYAASRKLGFLIEHPLVCGLFFGAAVEEVMRLIVLPLSALHAKGPYKLHDLILGLLVHMVVVGLPISFTVRRFAKS